MSRSRAEQQLAAFDAVDPKAAEAEAEEYWLKAAKKIVEPSREEIIKLGRGCSWRSRT